ncbi:MULTISPECIES: L-lactate dehydrogenase [Clostridium]|uniref:L-lactate dehydrogenase n=2 Tax=Clostridium butyricum TaxID=1492 RepID=C4IIB5_CLOBU|nr:MULTISPECIES: L-lactate dehydrogenase [Clostridium]EDT76264.1 L-lactate dehydrogenase [Clostridium butyricum 5521]EEP54101.1 L-lactate dehydrogenase [Clostridium butyricum E4 str. BoNT E BL5262]MBO1685525.1 L-lactate dehydrogenase [Clostridium butyricum]MDK2829911.1 L-lactate dehydrogenase [Clostridium butyricum]MDM8132369.1 L-lactate dehydrogenase [Clostridium butyricum]
MSIKTRKVVIVGSGNVGSHCAFSLAVQGVCDEIIMIDKIEKKANAEAVDLSDTVSYLPHYVTSRKGTFEDCSDADIIVVSLGVPPEPNKSRLDFLEGTIREVDTIIDPIMKSGFDGIIVVISNPVDVVANYILEKTKLPKNRVFGTGTTLDSSRLRRILSHETGIDAKSIQGYTMGEHGDSQMVPWSHVSLGGKPIFDLIKEKPKTFGNLDLDDIEKRAAFAAYEIIAGKGCTEFGIGVGLTEIVKTILHNERKILPATTLLNGEYGQTDVFASVPVIMSKDGIEEIIEINLTNNEKEKFNNSCNIIRSYIEKSKEI